MGRRVRGKVVKPNSSMSKKDGVAAIKNMLAKQARAKAERARCPNGRPAKLAKPVFFVNSDGKAIQYPVGFEFLLTHEVHKSIKHDFERNLKQGRKCVTVFFDGMHRYLLKENVA